MRKYFFVACLLCLSSFANARSWSGLYLGVSANGGLAFNPNAAYEPGFSGYGDYGLNAILMISKDVGISGGVIRCKYKYDINYDRAPVGVQTLQYLRVPLGMHLLTGKTKSVVRFDLSFGLNVYFLQNAQYKPGSYNYYGKPTVEDNTVDNFHKVGLGTYAGCGMFIKMGTLCNLLLGAQFNTAFWNQNKSGLVQNYSMDANLFTLTFNAGFQFQLCSWDRKWYK